MQNGTTCSVGNISSNITWDNWFNTVEVDELNRTGLLNTHSHKNSEMLHYLLPTKEEEERTTKCRVSKERIWTYNEQYYHK